MRTRVTTLAAIVVLVVCATAALAATYECYYVKVGNQFTYTVKNNHASNKVVEWCLRWSCNDVTNAALSWANFRTVGGTGYISLPTKWYRSDADDEPRAYTDDPPTGDPIMPGGSKSFTIQYLSPSSTPAPLFRVATIDANNQNFTWSGCMNVIPEPGTIAILLTGLAGTGVLFRRKTR